MIGWTHYRLVRFCVSWYTIYKSGTYAYREYKASSLSFTRTNHLIQRGLGITIFQSFLYWYILFIGLTLLLIPSAKAGGGKWLHSLKNIE